MSSSLGLVQNSRTLSWLAPGSSPVGLAGGLVDRPPLSGGCTPPFGPVSLGCAVGVGGGGGGVADTVNSWDVDQRPLWATLPWVSW